MYLFRYIQTNKSIRFTYFRVLGEGWRKKGVNLPFAPNNGAEGQFQLLLPDQGMGAEGKIQLLPPDQGKEAEGTIQPSLVQTCYSVSETCAE